jgi:hypothetical protein
MVVPTAHFRNNDRGARRPRHSVLSAKDREANDVTMICVGRSNSSLLVLDI